MIGRKFKSGDVVRLPDWLGGGAATVQRYQGVALPFNTCDFGLADLFGTAAVVVRLPGGTNGYHWATVYEHELKFAEKPEPGSGEFHTDSKGVRYVNTGRTDTAYRWAQLNADAATPRLWHRWEDVRDR